MHILKYINKGTKISPKYLRFHVKSRFCSFIAWFLVLQNQIADAIFNFLTTLPEMDIWKS